MGLGDGAPWWSGYEWWTDADLAAGAAGAGAEPAEPAAIAALGAVDLASALCEQVAEARLWRGRGPRLLLVDLDNLRAGPTRWQARMAAIVELSRTSDEVVLAGQVGAVERARPHLAGLASRAIAVPDGSDLADHALLEGAAAFAATLTAGAEGPGRAHLGQVVVASNDGIFADLVDLGWSLTVLSPGSHALSDRLRDAASTTLDLVDAERAATRRWRSRNLRATARSRSSARRSAAAPRSSRAARAR